MLPDLSATHIMLLVVVALIVVGPKDLPSLLRKIGQFMARLRGMANEFRASFDEMARQSELDELRKEVEAMRAAAAKPVDELKDHVSTLMEQSTVSLDHGATAQSAPPVEADIAEPQRSILPPPNKPKTAKPKTAKPKVAKTAPKPKTSADKRAGAKPAPKKAKPKASTPGESGQ
jgi:sec-independent protein translocase protein TatB